MKPVIIRVGQLSGVSTSGFWNAKEWVPALFKSSLQLGCLPIVGNVRHPLFSLDHQSDEWNQDVSWIPIDIAARVVCDVRDTSHKVLHLAHPNTVPWTTIFSAASEELKIPLVSYSEWFDRLSRSAVGLDSSASVSMMERSPALRILDFFRASEAYGNEKKGREAMGLRRLDLSLARNSSPSLKKVRSLAEEDARSWISYWKSIGFLNK